MYQAEGALAVGTRQSDQNVGGARSAVNPRLTAHRSVTKDTTIDVDGMKMNTLVGGGDSHPDHNDAMTQETTVQTAALGAEVSAGGPHLNLIPREGGNHYSGATYLGYTDNSFQSNNLGDLISRGLQTPDAVSKIYDANLSLGGPDHARQAVVLRVVSQRRQRQHRRQQLLSRTAIPASTISACGTTRFGSPGRPTRITSSRRTTTTSGSTSATCIRRGSTSRRRHERGRRC